MKLIKILFCGGRLESPKGSDKAPDEVIKELKKISLNESFHKPNYELEEVKADNNNLEETHKNILNKIKEVKENFIVLGGDHSITYSCFKAFAKNNTDAGLLVFDAHPDMMQSFSQPTHENYLRTLIEEGILNKENLVLVGLRVFDEEEYKFLKSNNIKFFSMKEISFENQENICDAVMSAVKDFKSLYISIDIDVIDPAFAPGTGYAEPGGLTSRDFLYFLFRIKNLKNIKAYDLVEINPELDINSITVKLGAKIISEITKSPV